MVTYDSTPVDTPSARHVEPRDLGPGSWWIAHEFPERPHDEWTVWDWGCDRCFVHMTTAAHLEGEMHGQICTLNDGTSLGGLTLAEAYQMAIEWRASREV